MESTMEVLWGRKPVKVTIVALVLAAVGVVLVVKPKEWQVNSMAKTISLVEVSPVEHSADSVEPAANPTELSADPTEAEADPTGAATNPTVPQISPTEVSSSTRESSSIMEPVRTAPSKSPRMRCGLHVLNDHNVGHIFSEVLPAMLDTADPSDLCTLVFRTAKEKDTYLSSPLNSIAAQLNISVTLTSTEEFERNGTKGVDFFYHPKSGFSLRGFRRLQQLMQRLITETCKCPEFPARCNVTKVTIFNRVDRHYYNHLALLQRLQQLSDSGVGIEWEYVPSTTHVDQCFHFCHYRNASIVFTPFGAETIYPIITNRSAVIMAYHGKVDNFFERAVSAYGFYGGNLEFLLMPRILEDFNPRCYNRWIHPPKTPEIYLFHKCNSYYMDQRFIDDAINTIYKFRKDDCERLSVG